jgi:uncharacterized lipoprotein YajG
MGTTFGGYAVTQLEQAAMFGYPVQIGGEIMYRKVRRWIAVTALAGGLTACHSFQEEKIAIAYDASAAPAAAVPGAEKVALSVVGVDRRSRRTDDISTKGGWGQPQVLATTNVVDLVRGAVADDFAAQGFAKGDDLTVTLELQNFYDVVGVYSTSNSGGRVAFTLRVKDRTGLTRYTHFYEAVSSVGFRFDQSAELTNGLLQKALADILKRVNEDRALQDVLLAPGRGR